jgi:hypothetical protein
MSTTNRIVLFDSWGDELFSGSSLLSERPAALRLADVDREQAEDEDEEEPIPETLRSSVSVRIREPVSRPIVIEEDDLSAA